MRLSISYRRLGALLTLSTALPAQRISADGGMQTFSMIAEQYFSEVYYHFSPTTGTGAGLHQYDAQLEDYSEANLHREIAALHSYEAKISAIDPSALDAPVAADRQILLNSIQSNLLTLEVIRPWEKNPDIYSSGITNSAFVLMERPFAPANDRLRSAGRTREADAAGAAPRPEPISRTRRGSIPRSRSSRSMASSASSRPMFPRPLPTPTIPRSRPSSRRPTPPSSPRSSPTARG